MEVITGTNPASEPPPTGEAAAHVLVFPFPAQGPLNTMLKLAELLSLSGLQVTFLNTDYNDRRASRFSTAYARLAARPSFRFCSIPDGLPEDQPRSASRIWELKQSLRTRGRSSLHDLLVREMCPPVSCVIADGLMSFAVEVAEEIGIPAFSFQTLSACCVWAFLSIPNLISSGELPFCAGTDMDVPIRSVPGMEDILRRRDLPSYCRDAKDATDQILQFLYTVTAAANQARGFILNTMETLDAPILAHIRTHCPTTYTIGPLQALLNTFTNGTAVSASLWEEDRSCIAWLDSKPHRSVIYVSFGSFTVVSREELVEFWQGLVNSGYSFLWVLRPGLTEEENEEMVSPPPELEAAVKERGCLVGWAPQQEVLAHPAVGCFLTHSGWNSTLESMTAGVPMICWPFFTDQQINSRYVSEVWRVGLDMKDMCERDVVERMVREAMEGESSEKLRRSAEEMAGMVKMSVEKGGTSEMGFRELISHIKSLSFDAEISPCII